MNTLEGLDHAWVLAVNGFHHPIADEIMWWISSKILWIPLYLWLFYLIFRKIQLKNAIIVTLMILATVALADFISAAVIKESVQRYRPSHHAELMQQLHFYHLGEGHLYQGGQYGFVSSHAANFFTLAAIFALFFKRAYPRMAIALFIIAFVIAYSRLYLGVHYPSDLLGGALLGVLVALGLYHLLWKRWKAIWEKA